MSYIFKTKLANRNNYGNKRDLNQIKYLVIHYTGNDGDSDENNANYFNNVITKTSAHYFVDDNSITQIVPDNFIAYAVGGKYQSNHHPMYKIITNSNSISIEMCDVNRNGIIEVSDKTLVNVYELVRKLMNIYKIDINHIYRHYDVNGKLCPNCNGLLDDNVWNKFKDNIINYTVNNLGNNQLTKFKVSINNVIARGQQHSINFTGSKITVDGIYGKNTKKNIIKCFQKAINLDYSKSLMIDGIFGTKSKNSLGNHYVKKGEKQYLVTAVEIALMCRGYEVNGVECPGIFGKGLEKAVREFQQDRGLKVDGIVGKNTILKLMQ